MLPPVPAAAGTPAAPAAPPEARLGAEVDALREARLRDAAQRLEASFLKEMLTAAGLGQVSAGTWGGGAGEAQFSSYLVEAQAAEMARAGGIGLAESLFEALKARDAS